MKHNLFSGLGTPLNYPHFTKWGNDNIAHLVTDPSKKVVAGDTVFVAIEQQIPGGGVNDEPIYNYLIQPATVNEIIEERKAKGQHNRDFVPLFQKLQVAFI